MYAGAQAQGVAEGVVLPFREGMALAGGFAVEGVGGCCVHFRKVIISSKGKAPGVFV